MQYELVLFDIYVVEMIVVYIFFLRYGDLRNLHGLTPAFPSRRASDLPGGPVRHEVGIGDQHARRIAVLAEHADRFARLDQQRLVIGRSEEHTSELQSLMRISYAVFCLQKKSNQRSITSKSFTYQH